MAKEHTIKSSRSRFLKYLIIPLRNPKVERRIRLGIESKIQEFLEEGNQIFFEGTKVCVKPYPIIKNLYVDIFPEPGTRIIRVRGRQFSHASPIGVYVRVKSSSTEYRISYEPKNDK